MSRVRPRLWTADSGLLFRNWLTVYHLCELFPCRLIGRSAVVVLRLATFAAEHRNGPSLHDETVTLLSRSAWNRHLFHRLIENLLKFIIIERAAVAIADRSPAWRGVAWEWPAHCTAG